MHIPDMIARWRLARRETLLYLARVSYRFGCAEKESIGVPDLLKLNLLSCSRHPNKELMGELVKVREKRTLRPVRVRLLRSAGRRLRCSTSMEPFMQSAILHSSRWSPI